MTPASAAQAGAIKCQPQRGRTGSADWRSVSWARCWKKNEPTPSQDEVARSDLTGGEADQADAADGVQVVVEGDDPDVAALLVDQQVREDQAVAAEVKLVAAVLEIED